jgi:uncharacterized protein YijF (DUF1287 family)
VLISPGYRAVEVKKPRKPKPKAKHRTQRLADAPRRAQSQTRTPSSINLFVSAAERGLTDFTASAVAVARRGLSEIASVSAAVSPRELKTQFNRLRSDARALSLPYSPEEREALTLLFLPFLLVASAVVVHQSVRTLRTYITIVTAPEHEIAPVRPDAVSAPLIAALPRSVANEARPALAPLASIVTASEVPQARTAVPLVEPSPLGRPVTAIVSSETLRAAASATTELSEFPSSGSDQENAVETQLALLTPAEAMRQIARFVAPPPLPAYDADNNGNPVFAGICSAEQAEAQASAAAVSSMATDRMTLTADAFALRLAAAAEAQIGQFVIYNDAYRSISYPMGDVPSLFGVCTDVIVRAYRTVGLDLQALVHQARAGRGDTNIDHRRTETLRRFFAAHGEIIPVTTYPEDYRPGDIVTYYRPQNRGARAHIAMVSSVIASSGRPMIVHNRGWGPQLEDALFVDQITGHYRYRGPPAIRNAEPQKGLAGNAPKTAASTFRPDIEAPASPVTPASFRPDDTPATAGQH